LYNLIGSEAADEFGKKPLTHRRSTVRTRLTTRRSYASNDDEYRRLYAGIGYEETGRWSEPGYERAFMRKPLAD